MWGHLSVRQADVQREPTGMLTCRSSSGKTVWKALGAISAKYAQVFEGDACSKCSS